MKLIWRRGAAALIVILALAATLLAPATADAQPNTDPQHACIFHVFAQVDCTRQQAVTEMVAALESYASVTGTYLVEGSGFKGRGSGWAFWEKDGSTYPLAIATALSNEGHFSVDPDRDPVWSASNDLLVYRCKDRVAVFATDAPSVSSPDDAEWWADNDCTTYPIDRVGATYFQVSVRLSVATSGNTDAERVRVHAVSDMVAALESYGAANGTYRVDGGGSNGGGTGWTFWEEAGSSYPVAIATVLSNEGHFPADAARDPLWSSNTEIEGDLMTYRCRDRVAVFTRHSTSDPSAHDSGWWARNGCTSYPITGMSATYFELSAPLPEH